MHRLVRWCTLLFVLIVLMILVVLESDLMANVRGENSDGLQAIHSESFSDPQASVQGGNEAHNGLQAKHSESFSNLSWTKFKDHKLLNIFLFISAYYDNRTSILGRPGVVIISYVLESACKPNLTCYFIYPNGDTSCRRKEKPLQEVVNHQLLYSGKRTVAEKLSKSTTELIVCPLGQGEAVPSAVCLSVNSSCNEDDLSGELMVGNLHRPTATSKIGVCLQGSLRQNGITNIVGKLDDFIDMCQFLGAEFITMYVSSDEVHRDIIAHLLTNYSQFVNLVEWRMFKSGDYYGQGGIIHDCIYRHMYTVDYLVLMDLDEMIIPLKHFNWIDMLEELETKRVSEYAGYSFINKFYQLSLSVDPEFEKCRGTRKISPYLIRTNELQCNFSHGRRSKYIVLPKLVVHAVVHKLSQATTPKLLFPVASSVAVNAHYRNNVVPECANVKSVDKYFKLKPFLKKYIQSRCNLTHH